MDFRFWILDFRFAAYQPGPEIMKQNYYFVAEITTSETIISSETGFQQQPEVGVQDI
jgi:hypothetical protein